MSRTPICASSTSTPTTTETGSRTAPRRPGDGRARRRQRRGGTRRRVRSRPRSLLHDVVRTDHGGVDCSPPSLRDGGRPRLGRRGSHPSRMVRIALRIAESEAFRHTIGTGAHPRGNLRRHVDCLGKPAKRERERRAPAESGHVFAGCSKQSRARSGTPAPIAVRPGSGIEGACQWKRTSQIRERDRGHPGRRLARSPLGW